MRSRIAPFLVVATIVPILLIGRATPVHAAGLDQFSWSAPGLTVSRTSNRYSDLAGFAQALVNSNGCSIPVDGDFGNLSTWNLALMQNGILGYNNGGVMDPAMWSAFQSAGSVYGARLGYQGFTDGYGTEYWGYYGGGALGAELGWNPFVPQWLFSPTPFSNRAFLTGAIPSWTIGSYAACA